MSNINSISLSGNVVRDPELRTDKNGNAYLFITIAVNEHRKDNTDVTEYIPLKAANGFAKYLSEICKKGDKLVIHGKLRMYTKEDEQTSQKTDTYYVDIRTLDFFNNKRKEVAAPDESDEP